MEDALLYLLEDVIEDVGFLTLLGLTHSAWWESSLKEGIGLEQNSQGNITVSASELGLGWAGTALGRLCEEFTTEELVDLQYDQDVRISSGLDWSGLTW